MTHHIDSSCNRGSENLLEGWERSETSHGLPYYINHKSESTQWDHPLLIKTLEELVDLDSIRYAAYRTSMKLRFIQKRLCFDLVTLNTVQAVFERQGLSASADTVMDSATLYSILVDMYRLSHTEMTSRLNVNQQAELALNWLLNLFDVNRTGCIRVMSVKVGLAALCSAKLSEKYRYFFRHLADHTNNISRKQLRGFLHDLIQIPEVMNESQPFGGMNVNPAVESCFSQVWGTTGVSEDVFLAWLMQEPQTLVWLPTLHRMAAAESVKHESKCNICKAYPIIGFRYKCLKCFNYDLCQQCFFTGRATKKHKLKHPTQEYCVATTSKQDTKAFMKIVRNNLSKKHCNKKKLRYLPIYGTEQPYNREHTSQEDVPPGDSHSVPNKPAKSLANMKPTDPYTGQMQYPIGKKDPEMAAPDELHSGQGGHRELELESVVRHLESENRELMLEIERLHRRQGKDSEAGSVSDDDWSKEEEEPAAREEVLQAYNQQLEVQLRRLRQVLHQSFEKPRGPLQPVSDNVPRRNIPHTSKFAMTPPRVPQQPPSYGISIGHSPLSRSMSVSRRHVQSPSAKALTELSQQNTVDHSEDVLSQLGVDTMYGSIEAGLSQTRFSLPSPGHSRCFPDEEAALEDLIERLDQAYPANMSHSVLGQGDSSTLEEMLRAANQIGVGLGGFAATVGHDLDVVEPTSEQYQDPTSDGPRESPQAGSPALLRASFHAY